MCNSAKLKFPKCMYHRSKYCAFLITFSYLQKKNEKYSTKYKTNYKNVAFVEYIIKFYFRDGKWRKNLFTLFINC